MCNTTTTSTSITLIITLLFQLVVYERISWYPNLSSAGCSLHDAWSRHISYTQNTQLQTFKHICNVVVYQ